MGADWEVATVADLEARGVLLVQDGNHGAYRPLPSEIVENGVPHIRAADIADDGRIDVAGAQTVADSAWERIKKGRSRGGDVLLTHKGTVGRIAIVPRHLERVLCSPQTTFWRSLDIEVIDQRFIGGYLRSDVFQAQLRRVMHETDMAPYVSLTNQRALLVSVPPIAEQLAIAEVLGALDGKIASNRRLRAAALDLLASFFVDLAGRIEGRVAMGEVAVVVKASTAPAVTPDEVFEQFSIPAFDRGLGPEVCVGSSMASAKTVMPADVVLLSKLNPATKRVWWPERFGCGRAVCSPEFVVLAPARVPTSWIYGCMAFDPVFYGQLLGAVTGTTGSRQRVKPSDALAATVPDARGDQVAEWDALARPLLDQNVALVREARTLTFISDALLPKLVSGQIRVPLSDDVEEQVGAAVEAIG